MYTHTIHDSKYTPFMIPNISGAIVLLTVYDLYNEAHKIQISDSDQLGFQFTPV